MANCPSRYNAAPRSPSRRATCPGAAAANSCRSSCWRPASRSSCVFVYGFILFTVYLSLHRVARCCRSSTSSAGATTRGCGRCRTGTIALQNLAIFASALYRASASARPRPRDPARPEDPRRRRAPADLPLSDGALLHRHRHGLEMVPRSRASGWSRSCTDWGWESFTFDWIKDTADGDLYASSSPRSGSPRASSWRCSWPGCAASTTRSSRRRRSTAPRPSRSTGASSSRMLRPVFLSAFVVLAHLAIKSYDLVIALTDGGPGRRDGAAGDLHVFLHLHPQPDGRSAPPSAVIMLMMIASIIIPYLYSELRRRQP